MGYTDWNLSLTDCGENAKSALPVADQQTSMSKNGAESKNGDTGGRIKGGEKIKGGLPIIGTTDAAK